jgi:hypothetical protein
VIMSALRTLGLVADDKLPYQCILIGQDRNILLQLPAIGRQGYVRPTKTSS